MSDFVCFRSPIWKYKGEYIQNIKQRADTQKENPAKGRVNHESIVLRFIMIELWGRPICIHAVGSLYVEQTAAHGSSRHTGAYCRGSRATVACPLIHRRRTLLPPGIEEEQEEDSEEEEEWRRRCRASRRSQAVELRRGIAALVSVELARWDIMEGVVDGGVD